MPGRREELDPGGALGALAEASSQVLTLYLPDKDKKGREVPAHETWVKDALGLLARVGGGATCLWGEGSWKNKPEDEPIIERTAVVYTYVDPKPFLAELPRLRKFLHRFGRETNQGEVVVEFDSLFYRIRKYDKE